MYILIFSTTFIWNISPCKKNWARYDQNVYWSSCKVSVILVIFSWNSIFLNLFKKTTWISNFMKIRPVGAEMFHAGERTDRHIDGRIGGQTWWNWESLFAILRQRLKNETKTFKKTTHFTEFCAAYFGISAIDGRK